MNEQELHAWYAEIPRYFPEHKITTEQVLLLGSRVRHATFDAAVRALKEDRCEHHYPSPSFDSVIGKCRNHAIRAHHSRRLGETDSEKVVRDWWESLDAEKRDEIRRSILSRANDPIVTGAGGIFTPLSERDIIRPNGSMDRSWRAALRSRMDKMKKKESHHE